MPYVGHGGSYPATFFNTIGNTAINDICMAVGFLTKGAVADE